MYDNIIARDYVKSEIDYRRSQIRSDLVGRRRRRRIGQTEDVGGLTWTKLR